MNLCQVQSLEALVVCHAQHPCSMGSGTSIMERRRTRPSLESGTKPEIRASFAKDAGIRIRISCKRQVKEKLSNISK